MLGRCGPAADGAFLVRAWIDVFGNVPVIVEERVFFTLRFQLG